MAIIIEYFQNTSKEDFKEGPFVLTRNPLDHAAFRIEMYNPDCICPAVTGVPEKYYGWDRYDVQDLKVAKLNRDFLKENPKWLED